RPALHSFPTRRSSDLQYAPIYQEAQEHLVGKVMEYIRGISVLRSFSKGDEGQREVRAAFQQKWDADYGQEKATAGVLRFYGLTRSKSTRLNSSHVSIS